METVVQNILCMHIIAGNNDRTVFKQEELVELANSIRDHGLAQPITVRPILRWDSAGNCVNCGEAGRCRCKHFEIVAGERRFRAVSQVLGWQDIPAIVRDLSDEEASAIMLIENVHRVDLNPMDEAHGYEKRIDQFGWTVNRISKEANVSAKRVEARLMLLKLVPEAQMFIADGTMGVQFGEAMSPLDNNRQRIAMQYIVKTEKPLLREFRAIVGKLLSEQAQDCMFDMSTFMTQAIQEESDRHASKYNRRFPVNESIPEFKRFGSIGLSFETYIAHLINTGDLRTAGIVGRIYQGMIEGGLCFPPKEESPLAHVVSIIDTSTVIDQDAIVVGDAQFGTKRFSNLEM